MRREMVMRWVAWGLALALAVLSHELCGRWLASRDPIAELIARDWTVIPAALGLYLARGALLLVLPGWALGLLARREKG